MRIFWSLFPFLPFGTSPLNHLKRDIVTFINLHTDLIYSIPTKKTWAWRLLIDFPHDKYVFKKTHLSQIFFIQRRMTATHLSFFQQATISFFNQESSLLHNLLILQSATIKYFKQESSYFRSLRFNSPSPYHYCLGSLFDVISPTLALFLMSPSLIQSLFLHLTKRREKISQTPS